MHVNVSIRLPALRELVTQDGLMAGELLAPAALHRVDPDGTVTQVADELWFPNGSVLTDDGVLPAVETFACAAPDFHQEARPAARQARMLAARVCVPGH